MQRVVIDIPDNKINFFMELINNLGFKDVEKLTYREMELVDDLKNSLNEVELHRQGKIKLQPAKDFLNEL
jgi:predicted methyltransferase